MGGRSRSHRRSKRAPRSASSCRGRSKRSPMSQSILVADDDDDFRDVLSEVLADLGYEVHQARDGQEALDRLRRYDCALVLLDLVMPKLTGNEVFDSIQ